MTHSGGKQHAVGDKGQRYEVTFFDPSTNQRRVFGWTSAPEIAHQFSECIKDHPSWQSPEIRDRAIAS